MSTTQVTFNPNEQRVHIDDESKTHHYFVCGFTVLQLITNGLQIYGHWGEFDSVIFIMYCLFFFCFLGVAIFYTLYNAYTKIISIEDIKYYREIPFIWTKLRYFKLKNNKIRFLNFKRKSEAPQDLMNYLNKYQISIKS